MHFVFLLLASSLVGVDARRRRRSAYVMSAPSSYSRPQQYNNYDPYPSYWSNNDGWRNDGYQWGQIYCNPYAQQFSARCRPSYSESPSYAQSFGSFQQQTQPQMFSTSWSMPSRGQFSTFGTSGAESETEVATEHQGPSSEDSEQFGTATTTKTQPEPLFGGAPVGQGFASTPVPVQVQPSASEQELARMVRGGPPGFAVDQPSRLPPQAFVPTIPPPPSS